jgi:hypothetical protein
MDVQAPTYMDEFCGLSEHRDTGALFQRRGEAQIPGDSLSATAKQLFARTDCCPCAVCASQSNVHHRYGLDVQREALALRLKPDSQNTALGTDQRGFQSLNRFLALNWSHRGTAHLHALNQFPIGYDPLMKIRHVPIIKCQLGCSPRLLLRSRQSAVRSSTL